jgi:hypothetical protein
MASGWTNKGLYRILEAIFNGGTLPSTFYLALVTSATTPDADTNTLSQLTEIAAGNGYTSGGLSLSKNTTDFPSLAEDDANNRAQLNVKDAVWTASGGTLPASGAGARWAVLTDANGTVGSREVWAFFDLSSDRSVSSGQTLTLDDPILRLSN